MHTIRLRGPWEFNVLSDDARPNAKSDELPTGKLTMPSDWGESLGKSFRGRVRYLRRFNCPTGLEAKTKVVLCLTAVNGTAEVSLNDTALGQMTSNQVDQRFDIGVLLQPANRLEVIVSLPASDDTSSRPTERSESAGGLIGEVRLEILES